MKSLSINNPIVLHSATSLEVEEKKINILLNRLVRRELKKAKSNNIVYSLFYATNNNIYIKQ